MQGRLQPPVKYLFYVVLTFCLAASVFSTSSGQMRDADDIYWSPLGSGMNELVWDVAVYDNKLIAGGHFTTTGATAANYIASWNGASWSPLGSGMDYTVYALNVYDNQLIAGGGFTTAGGVSASHIAFWDGISWPYNGSGMNSMVVALTVYDNELIAGGHFTNAGGVGANYIAAWDGVSWSPLGSGMDYEIHALTVYDNQLIAGGQFTTAGSISTYNIAAWDGASWSALSSGILGSYVLALTVYDNKLIAGGNFGMAGGVSANYIAAWDGISWSPLGSGMNGAVNALTVYDNQLIAGGDFNTAGGVSANNIAAWDGASWSPLGAGMDNYISGLTVYNNRLIAGGNFASAGGKEALFIAQWNKAMVITVTNTDDSGEGSLRWALDSAAVDPAENYIYFSVSGTIAPLTPLPPVQSGGPVHILGSSAPGPVSIIGYSAGGSALQISSGHNTIEGLNFNGFTTSGIYLNGSGTDSNTIINNSFSACGAGIIMYDSVRFTQIGSNDISDRNYFGFNGHGILVDGCDSNYIVGNQIGGEDVHGDGNTVNGIDINNGHGNIIASNLIAYNSNYGIQIHGDTDSSLYNTITRNQIYKNGEIGIDLHKDGDAPGLTVNDVGDVDTGPNNLLNYPQIDSAYMNPDSSFTAYGKAADSAVIEFFIAHPVGDDTRPVDPSDHGEAYEYIGSDTADESGAFIYDIDKSFGQFSVVTATATDTFGNTSEFSQNFTLIPSPLIIVGYAIESQINLTVTDPDGYYIGKDADGNLNQNLFPATYAEIVNDSINIQHPIEGTYTIDVVRETGTYRSAAYSVGIRINGTEESRIVVDADIPPEGEADTYEYVVEEEWHYINGDANRDEELNILDIVYLINYKYKNGPAPYPLNAGDVNCNLEINILDIVYLINYKYKNGPEPCRISE